MQTIYRSVDIKARPRDVYSHWMRHREFSRVMDCVVQSDFVSAERSRWVLDFAGYQIALDVEITRDDPFDAVEWRSVRGPAHRGRVTIFALNRGESRLLLEVHYEPGVFAEEGTAFAHALEDRIAHELENFKQWVELSVISRLHSTVPARQVPETDLPPAPRFSDGTPVRSLGRTPRG